MCPFGKDLMHLILGGGGNKKTFSNGDTKFQNLLKINEIKYL